MSAGSWLYYRDYTFYNGDPIDQIDLTGSNIATVYRDENDVLFLLTHMDVRGPMVKVPETLTTFHVNINGGIKVVQVNRR